jgi:hypothetical protein
MSGAASAPPLSSLTLGILSCFVGSYTVVVASLCLIDLPTTDPSIRRFGSTNSTPLSVSAHIWCGGVGGRSGGFN